MSTIAGTPGVPGNVNGPAHQARFNRPKSLAFHANTNCVFVSEWVGAPDAACIRCVDLESKTVFEDPRGLAAGAWAVQHVEGGEAGHNSD